MFDEFQQEVKLEEGAPLSVDVYNQFLSILHPKNVVSCYNL